MNITISFELCTFQCDLLFAFVKYSRYVTNGSFGTSLNIVKSRVVKVEKPGLTSWISLCPLDTWIERGLRLKI